MELIEAHLLFGIGFDRIEVVVHRQSVVHSMVEFTDGATDRHGQPAGHADPDRAGHGLAATGWPGRRAPVDWSQAHTWTFEPLDEAAFPAVTLARAAGRRGRDGPGRLQRGQRGVRGERSWPGGSRSRESSIRWPR